MRRERHFELLSEFRAALGEQTTVSSGTLDFP